MGAKRLGGKRPGGKRLGGETTRGRNGLGAKRPGFLRPMEIYTSAELYESMLDGPLIFAHLTISSSLYLIDVSILFNHLQN